MIPRTEERSSDYDMGRMAQAVETLAGEVSSLKEQVQIISNQLNRGKGVVAGMLIAAGGIGAGLSEAMRHMLK